MELERKALRVGVVAIALSALLRLLGSGLLTPVQTFLARPETLSFLIYLQTGRVLRPSPPTQTIPTEPAAVPATEPHTLPTQPPAAPAFTLEDAGLVEVSHYCDYAVDIPTLLLQELTMELRSDAPTVLILHTHATESYTATTAEHYTESSPYRTLDTAYNMVSIGAHVAKLLEEQGIHVIHATALHDHPSYSGAYNSARKTIESYLKQYPSIRLVLDLHRDALSLEDEVQLTTHATVDGREASQLMMVVGTDASGLSHPNWEDNMALAVQLHALLEKQWPGLCRSISFRKQRFNQDLSPGAMLIEVGAAGDTHEKALNAATALAQAIVTLFAGD